MTLAQKLARLKARRGLTTEALSQRSGVPRGTINKLLNGETRNPTVGTLAALAEALECPLTGLRDGGELPLSPDQPERLDHMRQEMTGRDQIDIIGTFLLQP